MGEERKELELGEGYRGTNNGRRQHLNEGMNPHADIQIR
jgi:hypothetical protein